MNYDFKKLQIQGGLRYDVRRISTESMQTDEVDFLAFENSYASLNYFLGGYYPVDNYKFRVNYSSGFRAPTTNEILSNGVHEGAIRYEIGNRDLKNEKASQIDLSLEYEGEHLTFIVNPFLNTISDFIYLAPVDSLIEGNSVYVYSQTTATLYGGEIQVHYHPHKIHWLHLESAFSAVMAKDENGNSLPLIPANKINSKVKMELSSSKIFKLRSIFIQHVFRMGQDRTAVLETKSAAYHLFNIGLNMEIQTKKEPLEINFGVNNLFNNQYIDHLSRFKSMGIPNLGIGVFAGIKLNFASQIQ
ncbi:MAG: iron complex outermembrane receptor protein [Candidatus Azotimanducaceae bacterium]|jgi:iron complex outermembrane receptor protein